MNEGSRMFKLNLKFLEAEISEQHYCKVWEEETAGICRHERARSKRFDTDSTGKLLLRVFVDFLGFILSG